MLFFLSLIPERNDKNQLYEHPFSQQGGNRDLIQEVEGIKELITAKFIRERFMTGSFCLFVLDFAGFASNTKQEFNKQVANPASRAYRNLFDFVTPSDIAWALMIYLDKEEEWKKLKGNQKGNQGSSMRQTAARPSKRRRVTPTEKLWTGSAKGARGTVGFSEEARTFYSKFKAALKEIPTNEWQEVWSNFWAGYPKDTLVSRRSTENLEETNVGEAEEDGSGIPEEVDISITDFASL